MHQHRRRKCRGCGDLFRPDPRNLRHQHYCAKSECRKASKAASQRRWLGKRDNRDYFRGAANVERVRAWRASHPGYWCRRRVRGPTALQEECSAQPIDLHEKAPTFAEVALQDLLCAQPLVLIGLIAHLSGTALQEDIARTGRRLQQLGQDIVRGTNIAAGAPDAKTPVGPLAGAPAPPPVQLGGPAPGA